VRAVPLEAVVAQARARARAVPPEAVVAQAAQLALPVRAGAADWQGQPETAAL